MPDVVNFEFILHRRTGANERHFAHQHIPELRQFVQTGFAENTSYRSDSWILLDL